MLTAIRSQRHRSFAGQWLNFQSKCAFEFVSRWCGVEVADPNIWWCRSLSIHILRRLGPIPLLSWLFTFLGLVYLWYTPNLRLFHLLFRLLRQFLLTLLWFAHFDLLELPLGLFRIFHLRGHGLFQGKLHFFSFIYKLGQFSFEFDGTLINFSVSPNFTDLNTKYMQIGGGSNGGGARMSLYDISFY